MSPLGIFLYPYLNVAALSYKFVKKGYALRERKGAGRERNTDVGEKH